SSPSCANAERLRGLSLLRTLRSGTNRAMSQKKRPPLKRHSDAGGKDVDVEGGRDVVGVAAAAMDCVDIFCADGGGDRANSAPAARSTPAATGHRPRPARSDGSHRKE